MKQCPACGEEVFPSIIHRCNAKPTGHSPGMDIKKDVTRALLDQVIYGQSAIKVSHVPFNEITNIISRRDFFAGIFMHAQVLANMTKSSAITQGACKAMENAAIKVADEFIVALDRPKETK